MRRKPRKYWIKSQYGNNLYIAQLHKGERILSSDEADQYRSIFGSSTNGDVGLVNGVSYDQVERGIMNNQTSNYYNTTNQSNGSNPTSAPIRSISIAKLAEHIVVREEADVDRIVDKMVSKLIEAEAAGV